MNWLVKALVGPVILMLFIEPDANAQTDQQNLNIPNSISGSDCLSSSNVNQYTLTDTDQPYAYRYVWWYSGWGVELIIDKDNPSTCKLRASFNATPGTLNVGVDYRKQEVYYKQYAKNIAKCNGGGHLTTSLLDHSSLLEPIWYFHNQTLNIQTPEQMNGISFFDTNGNTLYSQTNLAASHFELSENLHGLLLVKVVMNNQQEFLFTAFIP